MCRTRALADQRLDHLRVDDRATLRDLPDGREQLIGVGYALLQQVSATRGAAFEERQRVLGIVVLADHQDTDLRVRRAQAVGGANAFLSTRRRHAYVGDDHVWTLTFNGRHERVEVAAGGDEIHV